MCCVELNEINLKDTRNDVEAVLEFTKQEWNFSDDFRPLNAYRAASNLRKYAEYDLWQSPEYTSSLPLPPENIDNLLQQHRGVKVLLVCGDGRQSRCILENRETTAMYVIEHAVKRLQSTNLNPAKYCLKVCANIWKLILWGAQKYYTRP